MRVKLKKQFKIKKIHIFLLSLVFIIIAVGYCFKYINTKGTKAVMTYASMEAKKISSIVINEAVDKNITEEMDINKLFVITKENSGEIKSIDFNSALVNKFLTKATKAIQNDLKSIESGDIGSLNTSNTVLEDYDEDKLKKGIICEVSTGAIFGNTFLANIGPKIPVKLNLIGDVTSSVSTDVTDYGINNALIQVYVNLKVTEQVIIPFYSEKIEIETKVPVALKMVSGSVPKYYMNGENSESVVVPTEE
jgi:sporulation protein YunB